MMKGWSSAQTLPKCSGHENASVMKGEAGSSNLPGSTTHLSSRARRAPDRAAQRTGDHLVAWPATNSGLTNSTILFALTPSGDLSANPPKLKFPIELQHDRGHSLARFITLEKLFLLRYRSRICSLGSQLLTNSKKSRHTRSDLINFHTHQTEGIFT